MLVMASPEATSLSFADASVDVVRMQGQRQEAVTEK